MKKIIYSLTIILFTCAINVTQAQTVHKDYWDGQVYFKLKNEVSFELPAFDANSNGKYPALLSSLLARYNVYSIKKAFPLLKTTELQHTYKILFRQNDQVEQFIIELQNLAISDFAEKIPIRRTVLTPNDPLIGNQYALTNISANNAWDLSTGSALVKIAIVDDEVKINHEDLAANVWVNPNEIAGNGIDDDSDGYIDDVNGFDVADFDPDPSPPPTATNTFQTHGTHCAGIADAVGNNGTGIASIGFGLSLIGVKCNPDTITNPTVIYYAMEGVGYAIAAHADVISMSWGGDGYSVTEQNVFNAGWAQGIVFVAAAGNDNSSAIFYPAAYNHIVSVGSTNSSDRKSGFSNFGTWVSLMAPGSGIYSSLAGSSNSYGNQSGTSMAAPMVAGLCGLIKSYNMSMTNSQIVSCLESSCDNIDAQNPAFIGQMGAGRINAFAALECANPLAIPLSQFSSLNHNNCFGTVAFTDLSNFLPTQWLWDFGDGDTSHLQNPTHQYLSSGTYTVSLITSNSNGADTIIQNSYAIINLPAAPTATSSVVCAGTPSTLTGTGADSLYWFLSPTGGTHVAAGNNYITPPVSSNTSYYLESDIFPSPQSAGPADSSFGSGSFFTNTGYHNLIFDCYVPATLLSVKVYAQFAGGRTITLMHNGVTIQSRLAILTTGTNTVTLNFNIPAGINFELGVQGNVGLFRNDGGAAFPYTLPGVLSIKGTNAADVDYYYYFYDWQVQASACKSPRIPVPVTVMNSPVAAFTPTISSDTVVFLDQSTIAGGIIASWHWDFGDTVSLANDTSDLQNPSHIYAASLTNACLSVISDNGCRDSVCQSILLNILGEDVIEGNPDFHLFPNPSSGTLTVSVRLSRNSDLFIAVTDALGEKVYSKELENTLNLDLPIDLSQMANGIYTISLRTNHELINRKIILAN